MAKTRKLIERLNLAVLSGDKIKEKKIWFKLLIKSLKGKKTFNVR
jgi:hypothetical protein